MKPLLMVVVMAGAAFAGGAAMNGPGLGWAKEKLRAYLDDAIPVASQGQGETKGKGGGPDAGKSPASATLAADLDPIEPVPAAPLPRLSFEPEPNAPAPSLARRAEAAKPAPADPAALPPLDVEIPTTTPPAAATTERSTARRDGQVVPASLPPLDEPVPAPAPALTPAPAPIAEGEAPWAALRKRMTDLGVRRYWIEGQPNGDVVFRCVVPIAGKNALAQHFEAEAGDEFRAAEIALRRVALWKATESP